MGRKLRGSAPLNYEYSSCVGLFIYMTLPNWVIGNCHRLGKCQLSSINQFYLRVRKDIPVRVTQKKITLYFSNDP